MPYSKASEVPDNVPETYKKQFMEVWNDVYATNLKSGMSTADAEANAFKQSHGVINKQKAKDKRDVAVDGPGFGGVVKASEDGGQVSDPTMSLRDQARDPDGKFASGTSTSHTPNEQANSKGTERVNEHAGRPTGIVSVNDKSIEHAQTLNEHMNEAIKEGNVDAYSTMSAAKNALGGLPVKGNIDQHLAALDEHISEFVKDGNHVAASAFKAGSDALKGIRGASQIREDSAIELRWGW